MGTEFVKPHFSSQAKKKKKKENRIPLVESRCLRHLPKIEQTLFPLRKKGDRWGMVSVSVFSWIKAPNRVRLFFFFFTYRNADPLIKEKSRYTFKQQL